MCAGGHRCFPLAFCYLARVPAFTLKAALYSLASSASARLAVVFTSVSSSLPPTAARFSNPRRSRGRAATGGRRCPRPGVGAGPGGRKQNNRVEKQHSRSAKNSKLDPALPAQSSPPV